MENGKCEKNNSIKQMKSKVAVIGAGAAGLAACRRLTQDGHIVTCFEKSVTVGGCWAPSDNKQQL